MDQAIRLLLRKYASSRNPHDAVTLAEVMLRLEHGPVTVWVLDVFDDDPSGSSIKLFFNDEDAWLGAASIIRHYLEINNEASPEHSRLFNEFHPMLTLAINSLSTAEMAQLVNAFDDTNFSDIVVNVYRSVIH